MSQPTPYTRQANFTDHSTAEPSVPHSGVELDAEFNALALTLAAVLTNLALIQRDDGALKNGSVGMDALSGGVLALINASNGIAASAWATSTPYVAGTNWVRSGTGTYVCATSHVSGTFATDLAAGKWVLIYDSAGSTPANGSVSTAKLADGAVTAAKLAITLLDLAGTIRAQGGLAAGTATVGELLAGKRAAGDCIAKIERTTKDQGTVGYRIGGGTGGTNWDLRQLAGSNVLQLSDGVAVRISWLADWTEVSGSIRATGNGTPTSGAGVRLHYGSDVGHIDAYDHTGSAWRELQARGSRVRVYAGGVEVLDAQASGVFLPVEGSIGASAYSIGYRDVPQNAQNGAYTLALSDRGKHVYSENVGGQSITIPANATVGFPVGTAIAIVNRGSNPISLTPAGGVTLRQAGTTNTGTRTIAVNGLATAMKVGADTWFVSGAGVS